jgi:hypothetical protein
MLRFLQNSPHALELLSRFRALWLWCCFRGHLPISFGATPCFTELYQLWLRQPLTVTHQNPHRPRLTIIVVVRPYRTVQVAVAMAVRTVLMEGDMKGYLPAIGSLNL